MRLNFRKKESIGRTAGEALDALTAQLDEEETGTLVIIQNRRSDNFFNASQQNRLTDLMEKRKTERLSAAEETELENLVEAELNGASKSAGIASRIKAMNRNYAFVASRARHICEYCRAPEAVFNLPFEVEHIKPLSQGGVDSESNLALSCRSCNLYKSDAIFVFDEESQNKIRLFNPHSDVWNEHFEINNTDQRNQRFVGNRARHGFAFAKERQSAGFRQNPMAKARSF